MLKKFKTGPSKLSHAVIKRGDLTRAQLEQVLEDGFGHLAVGYHNPLGWKLAAACLQLDLSIDDTKSRWSDDGKILFLTVRYATDDRVVGEQIRCTFVR